MGGRLDRYTIQRELEYRVYLVDIRNNIRVRDYGGGMGKRQGRGQKRRKEEREGRETEAASSEGQTELGRRCEILYLHWKGAIGSGRGLSLKRTGYLGNRPGLQIYF